MKLKYFALAMACVMALALTGCSANRDGDVNNTAPVQPTNSVSANQNDRPSAGVGGGAQNSPDLNGAQNSAGVNDKDHNGSGVGNAIDDIGDAAGDVVQGAGSAIDDVGNAVGDAVNGTGKTMP